MDVIGDALLRIDGWLFHLASVLVGVAVLVATVVYSPPGTASIDLLVANVDPFYLLVPLSALYTCWCGVELWRWVRGDDVV